jgi:hypothetical protein
VSTVKLFAYIASLYFIDILRLNYPAFSINLATQDACLSKDQDGSHVDIILNNFLPCVRNLLRKDLLV